MILVIDNYDSFVHTIARYLREANQATRIVRNDALTAEALTAMAPSAVVISPGPRAPRDAGVCLSLLAALSPSTPLLGVCLGHQCLVEAFGGRTVRSIEPLHGEAAPVFHAGEGLFASIDNPMSVGRYHSLVSEIAPGSPLEPLATSARGELMAVRRVNAPWYGVQFHPESLLTPQGRLLIGNFLREVK